MNNIFIQHLRREVRRNHRTQQVPYATLVARRRNNGEIMVTVSVCHQDDSFSKRAGIITALKQKQLKIPNCWKGGMVHQKLPQFLKEASKHFGEKITLVVPNNTDSE